MNDLIFYIDKFIFTLQDSSLDLEFIPSNTRRRLNLLDKHSLYSINYCMNDSVQNIVFSSQYGGFDRMLKLIGQYRELNEVSPTVFSASVHNYCSGQYTLLTKKSIPTLALAGGENTFIDGLISSITLNQPLVYCFADYFGDIKTICISLSQNKTKNKYKIKKDDNTEVDLKQVVDLFLNKTKSAKASGYIIESLSDE